MNSGSLFEMDFKHLVPLMLLTLSNVFMTYAWYGHLRTLQQRHWFFAVMASWGIAFFEYCLQVPANRIGAESYTLPQLKIIQEVLSLCVFVVFAYFYMGAKITWNMLWAAGCLLGAVFFIFKDRAPTAG